MKSLLKEHPFVWALSQKDSEIAVLNTRLTTLEQKIERLTHTGGGNESA